MIRKLLTALGIVASAVSAAPAQLHTPYEAEAANTIYNLLICDDLSAFVAKPGEKPALWQRTLASTSIDIAALEKLAGDPKQEGACAIWLTSAYEFREELFQQNSF